MFNNVGWGELLVLLVVVVLVLGPERLPGLLKDIRAVMLAVRNSVGQARQQLEEDFGEEYQTIAKPLSELNKVRAMGPKQFITKTIFDGDDSYLQPFTEARDSLQSAADVVNKRPNIKQMWDEAGQQQSQAANSPQPQTPQPHLGATQPQQAPPEQQSPPAQQASQPQQPPQEAAAAWDDVT